MEVLSIIPARGGSKGLPKKNIKLLKGKPLIAYTIEAAKKSKLITRTIVTTEDLQIANIAKEYEAEVPFIRPMDLALDHSKSIYVVLHCINWLKDNDGYIPDIIVFMQPTSPLRNHKHVDAAIQQYKNSKAKSVISVCESEHSPYWANKIENNRLRPLIELPLENPRRQDLPITYRYNGAIYITSTNTLTKDKTFINDVEPYVMTQEDSVDIDTFIDYKLAEAIIDLKQT
mgnify:CR=1 FL=1